MTEILFIIFGAAIAGFAQGLSGFAFGMISMSIWAWVIEPHQAAALVVFGALFGQLMAAFTVKRGFNLKTLGPYILGGLVGIPIGVTILPLISTDWFKICIGGFLTICCPTTLLAQDLPKIKTRNPFIHGIVGFLGGTTSSFGGFAGLIPSLWCTMGTYEKDEQRNIIQNFSLTMLAVTMATYIYKGMVSKEMLPLFLIVIPSMVFPTWLGMRFYTKISPSVFRRIVLILLTISGFSMFISGLINVLLST